MRSDAGLEAGERADQLVSRFDVCEMESQQREMRTGSGSERSGETQSGTGAQISCYIRWRSSGMSFCLRDLDGFLVG